MSTKSDTIHTCPICSEEGTIRLARCSNASCPFVVTTCSRCDREQVVAAFVADHEKDCIYGSSVNLNANPPTFSVPRRVA